MRIKAISATYGRKFNLGNYNSMELSATAWADLDENDNPETAMNELGNLAKEQVRNEATALMATIDPTTILPKDKISKPVALQSLKQMDAPVEPESGALGLYERRYTEDESA